MLPCSAKVLLGHTREEERVWRLVLVSLWVFRDQVSLYNPAGHV